MVKGEKMKTITKEWLVKNGACEEGIEWFKAQGTQDTKELLKKAVKDDATYCIKFFIEKAFNKDQSVKLAVYSARLCLENFERKFPDDDRPRKAIEAAENWIKNQCKETELAARSAARSAWSAAWSAARSAWSAAW